MDNNRALALAWAREDMAIAGVVWAAEDIIDRATTYYAFMMSDAELAEHAEPELDDDNIEDILDIEEALSEILGVPVQLVL